MKAKNGKIIAAVLFLSATLQMTSALTVVLDAASKAFPNVADHQIQLIYTLTYGASMVFSIIVGKLVNYTSKKNIVLTGLAIMMCGALVSYFASSILGLVYVGSILIGSGHGCIMPVSSTLVVENFEDPTRTTILGFQSVAVNAGGMLVSALAGMLIVRNWANVYLTFLVTIPIFLVVLFLLPQGQPEKSQKGSQGKLFTKGFVLWLSSAFVMATAFTTFTANVAFLTAEMNNGDSSAASLATVMFLLGNILAGFLIGLILKALKEYQKYAPAVGYGLIAVGIWMVAGASGMIMIYAAGLIIGFGAGSLASQGYALVPQTVSPAKMTLAVGIFAAAVNIAVTLNPYTITLMASLFGDAMRYRFVLAGVLITIIAVVNIFFRTDKYIYQEGE